MDSINSTRTDNYLKSLPLIVGLGILLALFSSIIRSNHGGSPNQIGLPLFFYASAFIREILFWLVVGKISQNMKASLVTLATTLVVIGSHFAQSLSRTEHYEPTAWVTMFFIASNLLVPFIFAFHIMPKGRYLEMLLFAIAVCYIPTHVEIAHQFNLIAELEVPLVSGTYCTLNVVDLFYNSLIGIAKVVIVLAFIEQQKKFDFGFSDKFLNFNNTYSKKQAMVIFLATKILIYSLPYHIISLNSYEIREFDTSKGILGLMMPLIGLLIDGVALYVVVQFYRKFVLEYLFSKEITPSYDYWFLLIPVVGTLIFLTIDEKKTVNPEKRVESFLSASNNNISSTILLIITGFQLLSLLPSINNPNFFSIMLSIIILGLLYAYERLESMIYGFIGLYILLFGCAFFHFYASTDTLLIILYQIALFYIWGGIFHIQSFEYLPNMSEINQNISENSDLSSF